MAQGKKPKYSNQSRHRGWQMLENSYRKTCGPFRLMMVLKIHALVSGRFCPTCTRDKNSNSSKRREYAEDPWQNGPCLSWPGKENREKSCHSLPPTPPIAPGRQVTQWPAAAFSLAGDGCGEGNFSAEVELLSADCR